MMSHFLMRKLIRKNKADFAALDLMVAQQIPITIEALVQKFDFSPSRAAKAIQNAYLIGILTPLQ